MAPTPKRKSIEPTLVPSAAGMGEESLHEAFVRTLIALMSEHSGIVVLDADAVGDKSAQQVRKAHPDRYFQFGAGEQNMIAVAGGMAAVGLLPVVTTNAASCLRALEQARRSIVYMQRNVKIVATPPGLGAGFDGGATHCREDLGVFRALPRMSVISPADPIETVAATRAIVAHEGPVYMRTGHGPAQRIHDEARKFAIGKGRVLREGRDVTLVACGVEVPRALEASEILARKGLTARVVNMATLKPLDTALLQLCALETGCFVTAENHNLHGGLGSAVAEALAAVRPSPIEFVGIRESFGEAGHPEAVAERHGLTAPFIAAAAERAILRKGLRS